MDRKDWTRIGLIAAICLVPGGFLLGGVLGARRYRREVDEGAKSEVEGEVQEQRDTAQP